MAAAAEADLGTPPPPDDPVLRDLAADVAGEYTLTFDGGRFDVALDTKEETFCTGTYVVHDDRVWLNSERGECVEIKFFDAAFEIAEGELRFDATDFRGEFPHRIAFTTRPLDEIG